MDVQESNFYYSAIKECLKFKDEVDICDLYKYRIGGIGYNELRYCSIDKDGELAFESNNVHDYKRGDTCYKIFRWKELTDYEMYTLYEVLCKGQRYNDKTDTITLENSMNYARRDEGFGCAQCKTSIRDRVSRDIVPSNEAMKAPFWSIGFVLDGTMFSVPKYKNMVNGNANTEFKKNGWHGMYVLSENTTLDRIYAVDLDFDIIKRHTNQAFEKWDKDRNGFTSDWRANE